MTCPDCRARVVNQPAPAYLIREINQTFINTAVLLPPGENTEDHKKFQRQEAELVERDRADPSRRGGLFSGRFVYSFRSRAPIHDAPDGVDRCPMCTWELEDGMCNSCGYGLDNLSYLDDEGSLTDAVSVDSRMLEVFGNHPDELEYDSTGSGGVSSRRRQMDRIRRRARIAMPARFMRHNDRRQLASTSSMYDSSEDEYLSDELGSPNSSVRDFIVDDMVLEDGANPISSDSEASSHYGSTPHGSESERFNRDDRNDYASDIASGEASDTTLVTTARRRSRGRRVAASSPEASDSEGPNPGRSSRQSSTDDRENDSRGGFSPIQQNNDGGSSQNIPIQIDSDSDSPPIRRTRRRPTTAPVSSDEDEDNDGRGVAIQPGMSDNSSTPNRRIRSPEMGIARQSQPQTSIASNGPPSPIHIGSSPARPSSTRQARSSNFLSPPMRRRHQRLPFSHPAYRHNRNENSATTQSSAREQSEQRLSTSPTPPWSPPPRETADQIRRERKRAKRIARMRRQDGRADSPQQLAYIGV
ncbi:MAG: hypothetical protein Q9170_000088 [Blastenia crenularia]